MLFSQETKNVGEIKGSEAVRFLRFISGSCEGLLVGHSLHKECAKDDIFLRAINKGFFGAKKYLAEILYGFFHR